MGVLFYNLLMTIFQTIIAGLVEGVTEFLPISSTGHLILLDFILKIPNTEFVKSFNIAIQLGAILAVVILYAKRLWSNRPLLGKVIIAFIPTAILGLAFYKIIKTYLLGSPLVVVVALALGGVVLLIVESWFKERKVGEGKPLETMTYREAIIIGLAQAVAMIPGVSRSAATIVGGLLVGFSRVAIVEFSFMLAIPTMLAATGLDLLKSGTTFTGGEWFSLLIGFAISFFVALLAIKWLLRYVQNHNFNLFAIYRIVLALVFWFIIF